MAGDQFYSKPTPKNECIPIQDNNDGRKNENPEEALDQDKITNLMLKTLPKAYI